MTAPEDQNGLREALAPCVAQALAAFRKEYGYHRPVIEELLIDFGEIVAGLAAVEASTLRAAEAEITRLKEEMEALGAALRPFADLGTAEGRTGRLAFNDDEDCVSTKGYTFDEVGDDFEVFVRIPARDIRKAHATLSPKEHPHG